MNLTPGVTPKLGGNLIRWILIGAGVVLLLLIFFPRSSNVPELEITRVIQMAEDGLITEIQVRGDKLDILADNGDIFRSRKESPVSVLELLGEGADGIQITVKNEGRGFGSILLGFLPIIILVGLFIYMIRGARGGLNQAMKIGKSQARVVTNKPSVSRVPGSGVRGRGSGERETTASSLAGKEESSRKEDNSGQGKDGPAGAIAQGGNGR